MQHYRDAKKQIEGEPDEKTTAERLARQGSMSEEEDIHERAMTEVDPGPRAVCVCVVVCRRAG